jgi:hypothetical protein
MRSSRSLGRVIATPALRILFLELLHGLLPWNVDAGVRRDLVKLLEGIHDSLLLLFLGNTLDDASENIGPLVA